MADREQAKILVRSHYDFQEEKFEENWSINKIAEKSDMAWRTAKKIVEEQKQEWKEERTGKGQSKEELSPAFKIEVDTGIQNLRLDAVILEGWIWKCKDYIRTIPALKMFTEIEELFKDADEIQNPFQLHAVQEKLDSIQERFENKLIHDILPENWKEEPPIHVNELMKAIRNRKSDIKMEENLEKAMKIVKKTFIVKHTETNQEEKEKWVEELSETL